MKRYTIGLFLLAALVAVFSWWQHEVNTPQESTARNIGRFPDLYAEQLTVTRYDTQGLPQHRIQAPRMRHFEQDNTTELEQPLFWQFNPGYPTWEVQGEQALLEGDTETIFLSGAVIIDRPGQGDIDPYHITTRDLTLNSRNTYAETIQPIRIESRDHWISGIGMQGWLAKPGLIKLLNQVRGHYASP